MKDYQIEYLLNSLDYLRSAVESLKDTVIHLSEATFIVENSEKEMMQTRLNDTCAQLSDVGYMIDNLSESYAATSGMSYIIPSKRAEYLLELDKEINLILSKPKSRETKKKNP